jgi:hypothetical protein
MILLMFLFILQTNVMMYLLKIQEKHYTIVHLF